MIEKRSKKIHKGKGGWGGLLGKPDKNGPGGMGVTKRGGKGWHGKGKPMPVPSKEKKGGGTGKVSRWISIWGDG